MAQMLEIDVVGACELLRSYTGSPRSPGESVQTWSMMELVGAAAAVSTEPGMLAAAPATAMAVLATRSARSSLFMWCCRKLLVYVQLGSLMGVIGLLID